MAAAISVGIDETDELMTDEDTLAGKNNKVKRNPKCDRNLITSLMSYNVPRTLHITT